jgi:hypothetical protein
MAQDGYAKASPSDADTLHGAGQGGPVLHSGSRHPDITQATSKGPDAGMTASLGRPRAASDMPGDSPMDHVVAPGQRTVTAPKGAPAPVKSY